MKLILLGPPGSGKGTITESLVKHYSLKHISPGEILREEVKKETTIGKDVQKYIEKGDLVPDQFVVELVKIEITNSKNFILDGFPRSIDQAKKILDIPIDLVIYLDVPEKIVIERLSARRMDPITKKIYNIKFKPAPVNIQQRLIQRKDDKPKVIKERFQIYNKITAPVVEFYKKKGIVISIDATKPIKEVQQAAIDVVKKYIKN